MFWQLRVRTAIATVRWMLATARLRMSLVASLSLFFWIGLFILFYHGFAFLSSPSIHTDVVEPLYNAFFLALMVMLMFSSGIILYSALFCSPEAAFLLTTPIRTQRIYQHKFQEAVWFSSWGFILLGSPTLGGLRRGHRRALVLLCAAVAVCDCLCPHSRGDRRNFVPAHRQSVAVDSRARIGVERVAGGGIDDVVGLVDPQRRRKRI